MGPFRRLKRTALATMAMLAMGGVAAGSASAAPQYVDSNVQFQSTANCSGLVGAHASTVGYLRDSASAAYPVPGDRYYGRINIGVGPTCTGSDAFRNFVQLPPNTSFDPGADPDGKVRCWYRTSPSNPWNEVTNDPGQPNACIEPQAAGNGYWDLGAPALGFGWEFEIHFPIKSTQVLNGNPMTAAIYSGAGGPNAMFPQIGVNLFTAPVTTINSGPGPGTTTNQTSPSFGFSANKQVQGFQCRLDSGSFGACSSPKGYSGLGNGQHTFRVLAISEGGTASAETTRTWTIDTAAPTATINSGPSGTTQQTSASFGFSSSESNSSFECKLDAGSFGACSSPKGYSGLSDGSHTFQVRARDGAGNVGNPATRTWTVDSTGATVPPTASITSGPSGTTTQTSASFGFTSSKPNSTFECKLDSGAYGGCTSPKSYSGLAVGSHTFQVRAKDAAGTGNPATRTWSVASSGGTGGTGETAGSGDDSATLCAAAQDKVKSAKKKLKKAKKSGSASKIKKAKKKLKKAKQAASEACA